MSELKFIGGYPEYMRELIKKVEETRESRIDKIPRQMTSEEREEVLNLCHPDYVTLARQKQQ